MFYISSGTLCCPLSDAFIIKSAIVELIAHMTPENQRKCRPSVAKCRPSVPKPASRRGPTNHRIGRNIATSVRVAHFFSNELERATDTRFIMLWPQSGHPDNYVRTALSSKVALGPRGAPKVAPGPPRGDQNDPRRPSGTQRIIPETPQKNTTNGATTLSNPAALPRKCGDCARRF